MYSNLKRVFLSDVCSNSYLRQALARVLVEPSAKLFALASPPPKDPSLHKPWQTVVTVRSKTHTGKEMTVL